MNTINSAALPFNASGARLAQHTRPWTIGGLDELTGLLKIATIVAMVRMLSPETIGTVAIALALFELTRAVARTIPLPMAQSSTAGSPVMAQAAAILPVAEQAIIIGMLFARPGPWSVIVPTLLAAATRHYLTVGAGHDNAATPRSFDGSRAVSEILSAARTHADKFVVFAALGSAALGVYYVAWSACLVVIGVVAPKLGLSAVPLLQRARSGADRMAAFRSVAIGGAFILLHLAAVQAIGAAILTPVLLGHGWVGANASIGLIGLVGLPMLVSTLIAGWLRAEGRAGMETFVQLVTTAAVLEGIWRGASGGTLSGAVLGMVAGHALAAMLCSVLALNPPRRAHGESAEFAGRRT